MDCVRAIPRGLVAPSILGNISVGQTISAGTAVIMARMPDQVSLAVDALSVIGVCASLASFDLNADVREVASAREQSCAAIMECVQ